ncbi:MAG: protocatechuate 3,4-dioxygenase [Betaproteobacteria bacterium]|jgi:protocatechuate 4,5-dioxygenase beta chain|nr:protocatechuate 3,4-dioxygenase [Betaproteobacteria bacterium]
MAKILGAVTTSHVPAIGNAIAKGLQDDPYWKPFFKGWEGVHQWLAQTKPDVAVVVYNDHGLQFFLDKLPTFAVGAAPEYRNADEGWGLPTLPPYRGNTDLSWHMIESLVADEFDITTCQEMVVDHAFTLPLKLMWPALDACPVATVPVAVNTVQHPLPTPTRCYKFGRALGRAIASYPEDLKVVLLGTGGLSHQLDGPRAGFINKAFDALCMEKLVGDPEALTRYSIDDLVEQAGTQGVEVINWLIARAALGGTVREVHRNYHIPISNTASGIMVLANAA